MGKLMAPLNGATKWVAIWLAILTMTVAGVRSHDTAVADIRANREDVAELKAMCDRIRRVELLLVRVAAKMGIDDRMN